MTLYAEFSSSVLDGGNTKVCVSTSHTTEPQSEGKGASGHTDVNV